VNYDVPNHHEDYVHRCGRTGRAGAKGTAVTFIGPDEERYAPDLVKALKESGRPVPEDLAALAEAFARKRKDGTAQAHGSGFGGSGFKFNLLEDGKTKAERKAQAIEYGADAAALGSASEDEGEAKEDANAGIVQTRGVAAQAQQQQQQAQQAQQQLQQLQQQQGAQPAQPHAMAAPAAPLSAAQQQAAGVSAAQAAAVAAFQAAAAAKMNASMAGALALVPAHTAAAAAARAGFGPGALMPIGAAPLQAGPMCPPPQALTPAFAAAAHAAAAHVNQSAHAHAQLAAAAAAAAMTGSNATPAQRAAAFAASLSANARGGGGGGMPPGMPPGMGMPTQADHFELEIEINDFPQHARWKVTHKDSLREISDFTGAAITTKGQYVPPGKPPGPSERKLYLLVEGPTERSVREAKTKIREILEVAAQREQLPGGFGGGQMPGRYSVL
jgi:ATP-dependent RNA helicase DDX46/PRP5